ncbi:hypothetical protein KI387_025013, partial [Taxus chinensis]
VRTSCELASRLGNGNGSPTMMWNLDKGQREMLKDKGQTMSRSIVKIERLFNLVSPIVDLKLLFTLVRVENALSELQFPTGMQRNIHIATSKFGNVVSSPLFLKYFDIDDILVKFSRLANAWKWMHSMSREVS